MIPSAAIAQLNQIPLPTLVADYMPLRRSGSHRYTAQCPFHRERTASFTVYPDHYYCFGCHAQGSAIDFLMRVEHLSFPKAAESLAERFGINIDPINLTRLQSQYAAEEAEFARWWLDRWHENALAEMYAAIDEDPAEDSFAGCVGRILAHYRAMTPLEKYKFFQGSATVRDRKEWDEAKREEREFQEAWMGLAYREWRTE